MSGIIEELREELFALQDMKYREFQCSLIPTVNKETVIGVRTPALRRYAKRLCGRAEIGEFLSALPHPYYDENNLHGFIISEEKDFDKAVAAFDAFLPYVDNWATCDQLRPKAFSKRCAELLPNIRRWMESGREYTVRFGIEMLMTFYLDEFFEPDFLEWVVQVKNEEYYVKIMKAWYFATALAKQYQATLPVIIEKRLDVWTHNKTIQKAVESYRVGDEKKAFLKTLKIK